MQLDARRGELSDWLTQKWVQATSRRLVIRDDDWAAGPCGGTESIGKDFFEKLAVAEGLEISLGGGPIGLTSDFLRVGGPLFDADSVHPQVRNFYEATSQYNMDAWGEWCGVFRPFGWLLRRVFSRRLQQLNVPLSALETSKGMTSRVLQLVDPAARTVRYTAWVRELVGTGDVIYAGSYSICQPPGFDGPCIKVAFPLPNGYALVVMKPSVGERGSLLLESVGEKFGDPGFYFVVRGANVRSSVKYIRTMQESIHVYAAENETVRADHTLTIWGVTFLRLHYHLTHRA